MEFPIPEFRSFIEYVAFIGQAFSYILTLNRKMGNTCMELSKFVKRASKYTFLPSTDIPCYLKFFEDKIFCHDGLVGFKEDFENDYFIYQKVMLRMSQKSLPTFRCLKNSRLNDAQKIAVEYAPKTDISIVSGGAGTGKTTIINQILKNFNRTFHGEKKVFVLAPTARAAKRAKETITEPCDISTVHYFAGWGHPLCRRDYLRIRSADFIIVDEASMLSAELFGILIQITNAPIILVGDVNQLPAVDAGNILKDLISLGVKTYYLTTNYRSDDVILSNANMFLDDTEFKGLVASERFEMIQTSEENVSELLANCTSDIILTPLRQEQYPGSCNSINRIIHERKGYTYGLYHVGEPVIIMNSNKKRGYVNGETGYVTAVTVDEIYVDLGDRVVAIKEEKDLDLNYASTIHKSQGSEYNDVAIYCPDISMLTRNTLYTALTRAKHRVKLYYTTEDVFEHAYQRSAHTRSTFLSAFAA